MQYCQCLGSLSIERVLDFPKRLAQFVLHLLIDHRLKGNEIWKYLYEWELITNYSLNLYWTKKSCGQNFSFVRLGKQITRIYHSEQVLFSYFFLSLFFFFFFFFLRSRWVAPKLLYFPLITQSYPIKVQIQKNVRIRIICHVKEISYRPRHPHLLHTSTYGMAQIAQ